jgi:glutamate/tyrosine decarboxylase-like PLP-dependent enzyme
MVISGAASVISDDERHDKWLAIPFGAGAAMTLDESALLLELDDVYWTERGVVSVQVTLGAISILAALRLAMRVVRRGERAVLDEEPPAMPGGGNGRATEAFV